MRQGRTIAVYSDTGGGKTTQIGELAKALFKQDRKRSLLGAADLGGHESIRPHERVGILDVQQIEQSSDPWEWVNTLTSGSLLKPDHGMLAMDSATSISEAIMNWITKEPGQIGQQKTQRFNVGAKRDMSVGANNESHYGLVQSFMLDQIWRSTWLAQKGIDVLWTFGLDRSEKADQSLVVGPKLAGHALTSQIPKWFQYCFRLVSIPVPGAPARHLLYLQEQPDLNGTGVSFGNPRYPLDASTELPAVLEPASIAEALRLIEQGQAEADDNLRRELEL